MSAKLRLRSANGPEIVVPKESGLKIMPLEALAKLGISLIPAKAGMRDVLKNRIPDRAPLARNDGLLHDSVNLTFK